MSKKNKILTAIIVSFLIIFVLYLWYVRGVDFWPRPYRYNSNLVVWEKKSPMPTARSEVGSAILNGKIYIVGGFDGFARTLSTFEEYDIKKDSWRKLPDLPKSLNHPNVASAENKIYVLGGYQPLGFTFKLRGYSIAKFNATEKIFAFDFEKNIWEEKTKLPQAVGAGSAVTFQDKIYLFGGSSGEKEVAKTFLYDPQNDKFEEKSAIPTPRDHLNAQVIDDKIYVAAGRIDSLSNNTSVLEIYNPKDNTWEKGASLSTTHSSAAFGVIKGKLYIFGGEGKFGIQSEVEEYDPKTNTWQKLPPMVTPRHGLGSASFQDKIYLIGGGKHGRLSITNLNEAFSKP